MQTQNKGTPTLYIREIPTATPAPPTPAPPTPAPPTPSPPTPAPPTPAAPTTDATADEVQDEMSSGDATWTQIAKDGDNSAVASLNWDSYKDGDEKYTFKIVWTGLGTTVGVGCWENCERYWELSLIHI